jgi:beta-glucosidase
MFDPPEEVPYAQIPYEVVNSKAHQALALTAARESLVLLKNEANLLPLSKDVGAIAVIGPNANNGEVLLGNYHGTPVNPVTPLAGIRKKLSPSTRLYYAPGSLIAGGVLPLEVIPTHHLYPADSAAQEHGLYAAYFDNPRLAGEPVMQRVDSLVDMNWKGSSPLTGQWGDGFSVRWSGYLCPPASGRCRLGVNGFNAYKLYLDGELLVEFEGEHDHHLTTKDVELEAGRLYTLQLDYCSYGIDSRAQLLWAWPGVDYQADALALAAKADVIVAVMGLSPLLECEQVTVDVEGFLDGDRTATGLPAPQEALLKQLHALGKPVVLVLLNGSSLSASWAAEHLPAIIEAWYPGEAGGDAIADVLFGDYNPAGRLPVTFYHSVADLPPFEDYRMDGRTYRFFQGTPLFPFGYGLSYTTFQFDNLQLDRSTVAAGQQVRIRADVTNTGNRAGDEVVQLYIRQDIHQDSASARLMNELKGFKRISLEPGECKTVTFTLFVNQLAGYDAQLSAAVRPGRVEVMVGNSSSTLPLRGAFEIVGPTTGVANEKVFFSQVQVY